RCRPGFHLRISRMSGSNSLYFSLLAGNFRPERDSRPTGRTVRALHSDGPSSCGEDHFGRAHHEYRLGEGCGLRGRLIRKRLPLISSPLDWQMAAAPVSHPLIPVIAERGGTLDPQSDSLRNGPPGDTISGIILAMHLIASRHIRITVMK